MLLLECFGFSESLLAFLVVFEGIWKCKCLQCSASVLVSAPWSGFFGGFLGFLEAYYISGSVLVSWKYLPLYGRFVAYSALGFLNVFWVF